MEILATIILMVIGCIIEGIIVAAAVIHENRRYRDEALKRE